MAGFKTHITTSAYLGAAYGAAGVWFGELDWGPAFLGAGLCTVGGMVPDLDSDSGVPVREMFTFMAAIVPALLLRRLLALQFTLEQILVIFSLLYLVIRYGLSGIFRKITAHRGMYHSLPALLISGLIVFNLYHSPELFLRIYLAVGLMLGVLSHLVLDELYAVDLFGKPNQFAGTALKFFGPIWWTNLVTYSMLFGLGYLAYAHRYCEAEPYWNQATNPRPWAIKIAPQNLPSPIPAKPAQGDPNWLRIPQVFQPSNQPVPPPQPANPNQGSGWFVPFPGRSGKN